MFRRISDLNGFEYAPLPQFNKMPLLKNLILRNCKINGTLHDYLGTIATLKHLDLSFNNISGTIPSTYAETNGVKFIFLTGNHLTGSLPDWRRNIDVDISYNNLSMSQGSQICQSDKVNLFSPTLAHNNMGTDSCLRVCTKREFLHGTKDNHAYYQKHVLIF
jgi:Leucine-rich repeat (LRR) protein